MSELRTNTRNLRKQIKNRNRAIVVITLIAVLALGHIAWCAITHLHTEHDCTVCNLPESSCTCLASFNEMVTQRAELEAEIESLKLVVEELSTDDGLCHQRCSVHCPEICEHSSTHSETSDWLWTIVGTKNVCKQGKRVTKVICDQCGKVFSATVEEQTCTEHSFGEDGVCKECGYKKNEQATQKPVSTPKVDVTEKPTATPTVKPTATTKPTVTPTVKPTATPTVKPTATSTAVPTATPTVKPTATPTVEPCRHEKTENKESGIIWSIVGAESTCRKGTKTIIVVCKQCGAQISTFEEYVIDDAHTFSNRMCTKCGYTKACSHTSVSKKVGDWEYTSVGSESVCQSGKRKITTVCNECGSTIGTSYEECTDAQHNFSGRTCMKCGYKKPLGTGYYVEEGELDPPSNGWVYDDDSDVEVEPVDP